MTHKAVSIKKITAPLLLAAVAALATMPAKAQSKPSNVLDLKYSIQDSEIVYPESFEKGSQKLLERWYLKNYTTSDIDATSDYDPGATDEEIRRRLAALPTVIDLPYNPVVKEYIERFTKRGRKQVTALLGLSSYYMPIFEQSLEEAGLPLELKYLPIIESGLDPTATSRHGAAGLWQFIIASAKGYDMEVNSVVDERRDPYISSERACRMLKDLYETYGDWSLTIAAYNCGPGTVNKALNRAGGTPETHDFWAIYYFLPEETRGYVPMFIAANYVMNYYPEHNISPVLATKPLVTDTIHLSDRVHFNQISAVLDIPVEELRLLNPQFRADLIPGTPEHPYNLILPSQQIHAFLVSQNQIMAYEAEKYARKTDAVPGDPNVTPVELTDGEPLNPADPAPAEMAAAEEIYEETHPQEEVPAATTPRRRRSETSAQTAAASATPAAAETTAQTKETAQKSETTQKPSAASQKKTANNSSTASNSKKTTKTQEKAAKTTVHTVTSGQNLSVIAKKYGVTVDQLKKANPGKGDMIRPGDKITIPSKSTSTGTKKRKR